MVVELDYRQAEASAEAGSDSRLARGKWPDESHTIHRLIRSLRCPLHRESRGSIPVGRADLMRTFELPGTYAAPAVRAELESGSGTCAATGAVS